MYNGNDESKFQSLRKAREEHVRRLRTALEKAGLREYGTPAGLLGGAIDQRMLQPAPTPTRIFDIENVIANAAEIRAALAAFDVQ